MTIHLYAYLPLQSVSQLSQTSSSSSCNLDEGPTLADYFYSIPDCEWPVGLPHTRGRHWIQPPEELVPDQCSGRNTSLPVRL